MSLAGTLARKIVGRVLRRVGAGPASPGAAPAGAGGSGANPGGSARSAAARDGGPVAGPGAGGAAASPDPAEDLEVELPVPGSLLVDIREPGELASGVAEGALLLPMDLVPHHLDLLPHDRPLTIYCAAGARSWGVAHWLREQGFPRAHSLAGGIGVFPAVGHPVAPPPGRVPGTRVRLPADAQADGVPVGPGISGTVLRQAGDVLEVVVHDAQGFPVRVTTPVAGVAAA